MQINMENLDLSVILPLSTTQVKDFDDFFKKAIESIKNQKVKPKNLIIVHSNDKMLIDYLDKFDFSDIETIKLQYDGEPNYCNQINFGVKNSDSTWVSFFEFDDEIGRAHV